jgi:DNA-binding NarL/FixJ family response regulator
MPSDRDAACTAADEDIARALQADAKAYILRDIAADGLIACLARLFEKLGVTSRTEAVRVATRRGLVRFD